VRSGNLSSFLKYNAGRAVPWTRYIWSKTEIQMIKNAVAGYFRQTVEQLPLKTAKCRAFCTVFDVACGVTHKVLEQSHYFIILGVSALSARYPDISKIFIDE
jgi:hypothetical protein